MTIEQSNKSYWPCFLNEVSYVGLSDKTSSLDLGNVFANLGDICLIFFRTIWEFNSKTCKSYSLFIDANKTVVSSLESEEVQYKTPKTHEIAIFTLGLILFTIPGIMFKAVSMLNSEVRYKHRFTCANETDRPNVTEKDIMLSAYENRIQRKIAK